MNLSFNNKALRGRTWESDALYLPGNENSVIGKLHLSTTTFTFRKPTDRQGWPSLSGDLPAEADAIFVDENGVVLRSAKGIYKFELFPSSVTSLRTWLAQKAEALRIVCQIDSSFLGSYDAYPHPFAELHKENDSSKGKIFQYLGECIPILKKPINWGLDDVSMHISDEKTEVNIRDWKYKETPNAICIDCRIYEIGFFDDSNYEFEFHYEISYLGCNPLSKYQREADNEKLNHRFYAEQHAYPRLGGTEDFVAKNPFGLKGYYRIKWSLRFD